MDRLFTTVVLFFCCFATGLAYEPPDGIYPPPPPMPVFKQAVRVIEVLGRTMPAPLHEAVVCPRQQSVIFDIYIAVGDQVKKGQKLIFTDTPVHALKAKQYALAEAEANEQAAIATMECAAKECGREANLAPSGAASLREYSRAMCEQQCAVFRREATEQHSAMAREIFLGQEYENSLYTLKAPIDGEIIEMNATLGEEAAPGRTQSEVWVRILDVRVLHVVCDMAAKQAASITVGSKVTVKDGSAMCEGKVLSKPPVVSSDGKIKVTVEVENPEKKLLCGAPVTVVFLP